jgi:hypothetical protein
MQGQVVPSQQGQISTTVEAPVEGEAGTERPVGDGMRDGAQTQPQTATLLTAAQSAGVMHTQVWNANRKVPSIDRWIYRPHYVRDLVWTDNDPIRMTLVTWTESAPPLPSPPMNELTNSIALRTIRDNPDLFKIVTPIDIDHLECLLVLHPNRPLVLSVCHSL